MAPTILIVEDETDLATVVDKYLKAADFNTHIIGNGLNVVDWVKSHHPTIILLDLMLPGKDGLSLCREIRNFSDVPIIMMTARVEEVDRLIGLESGADDYVCKPFSVRELVARIKVIIRRLGLSTDSKPTTLVVDKEKQLIQFNGKQLELTAVEFNLFHLMHSHPGRIYSRQQIIDQVYSDYRVISDRTVDSHIRNLRKKLAALAGEDELIHTIYSVGYKFEPPGKA